MSLVECGVIVSMILSALSLVVWCRHGVRPEVDSYRREYVRLKALEIVHRGE